MDNKILIKRIFNDDNYNELELEKSEIFLDNLQDFIIEIGLAKINEGEYEYDGISYDMKTYYSLFREDPKEDFETKKLKINDFDDGQILRYSNKEIELLIIFLVDKIKLVFFCDTKRRKKVIDSLLNFCIVKKI